MQEKFSFRCCLLFPLAAGAAHAQQAAPQAPADEMKAAVDDKFRQLDANGDGTISQEESTKMKGASPSASSLRTRTRTASSSGRVRIGDGG